MRSKDGYLREEYIRNGKYHRDDGPAIVQQNQDGSTHVEYYRNGELHREDGPAFVACYDDGSRLEMYYLNGQKHREEGPALIATGSDGKYIAKHWCNHGELIKREKGDWVPPSGMQKVKATLSKIIPPLRRPPHHPAP